MTSPITTPVTVNLSTLKTDLVARLEAFITGLDTLLPGIDPFVLSGIVIGRADLVARARSRIDAAHRTTADRKTVAADVATERELDAALRPLMKGVKAFLVSRFGENSPQMQQMGCGIMGRKRALHAASSSCLWRRARANSSAAPSCRNSARHSSACCCRSRL